MRFFLAYLFLEICVSIPVFARLGVLGTFFEIIFSAFLGFFFLTNSSYTLSQSFGALKENKISTSTFTNISFMTILGAIFLIIPGILTDIIGILFQFGFVLSFISRYGNKEQDIKDNKYDEDDIIDVEIIEHHESKEQK